MVGDAGRWRVGVYDVAMALGWCVCGTRGGEGLGAKKPKSSHWGSILGVPLEVAAEGDAGSSWGGANDVATVVG